MRSVRGPAGRGQDALALSDCEGKYPVLPHLYVLPA